MSLGASMVSVWRGAPMVHTPSHPSLRTIATHISPPPAHTPDFVQVGKIQTLKGRMLIRSLSLICAKTVILPVLITILLSALKETEYIAADGTSYHLNLFGFLVGTFPTAPGVFSYAMEYNVDPEDTASALVLGTRACGARVLALHVDEASHTRHCPYTKAHCWRRPSCLSRQRWRPST